MITSIDRNNEGAWRISGFAYDQGGEYLLTRVYYFHTKREAIRLFNEEIKHK